MELFKVNTKTLELTLPEECFLWIEACLFPHSTRGWFGEETGYIEWTEGCNRHQHQNQVPWLFSKRVVCPNDYQVGAWILESVLSGLGRRGSTSSN